MPKTLGVCLRFACLQASCVLMILALGCDKIQTTDAFEITLEATARLPAGEGQAPLAFPGLGRLLDVELSSRPEFTDRGYTASDATNIELARVHIFAVQPPAQTLGFFSELRVVIDSDGLPALVAAQGKGEAGRLLTLTPQGTDVREYLAGRRGVISLQAGPSTYPPAETTLRLELIFEVTIGD